MEFQTAAGQFQLAFIGRRYDCLVLQLQKGKIKLTGSRARLLFSICAFGLIVGCGRPERQAKSSLDFESAEIDLGEVLDSQEISFSFRNTSDHEIQILELGPSCTCLTPRIDNSSIAAGETSQIRVGIDFSSQKPGQHNFRVLVKYKDPEPRNQLLRISAFLYQDIVLTPSFVSRMVIGNELDSFDVTLTNFKREDFTVTSVECSSPSLSVSEDAIPKSYIMGWNHKLKIRIDSGGLPVGETQATVKVNMDDENYSGFVFPVTITKLDRLVYPKEVQLADKETGSTETEIHFKDRKGEFLEIDSVKVIPAELDLMTTRLSPHHILLQLSPSSEFEYHKGQEFECTVSILKPVRETKKILLRY